MHSPALLEAQALMLEECERMGTPTALVASTYRTYVNVLLVHGVPPKEVANRVTCRIADDKLDKRILATFDK